MKRMPQLTLSVAFAFFVVVAAFSWTTASPKVTGQTRPTSAGRTAYAAALLVSMLYFKRRGEDSILGFLVVVSARVHSLWATWMAMATSIF